MTYAYERILETPAVFKQEQRDLAHECEGLVKTLEAHGADMAVQDDDLRFYSKLRRARDIEARLAYETWHGFVPLLPELFEVTPDELAAMDQAFQSQFFSDHRICD